MGKRKSRLLLAILLAIVFLAAGICGCSAPNPAEQQPTGAQPAPESEADTKPSSEPEAETVPEPEPEPEPVPAAWLPLTGEGIFDENDPRLSLRPLSVKIENTTPSRPSMGLTYADVVYETITEGGITRFNAIFHSRIPDEAGSIRSGRNSDNTIVPQYGGLFVFSGSNQEVLSQFAVNLPARISEGNAGKSFYRVKHKSAPHNLYFNPRLGYERFEELGHDIHTDSPKGLDFGENDMGALGGEKAAEVYVPFSSSEFNVTWKYDQAAGAYLRFIGDVAQVDESDNTRQVKIENVVILGIPYYGGGGGGTLALNLTGEGSAKLLQNGMCIDVFWYTDGSHPPKLKDSTGRAVYFKPGQTWFQVPGADLSVVEVYPE